MNKRVCRNGFTKGGAPPEYGAWYNMHQRCNNPEHYAYADYGGRGIKVCERWNDLQAFLDDMGPRLSKKHSLDRTNNNGHYEPNNCAWRTKKEQANNRRSNRIIPFNGETKTMMQWAEQLGIKWHTLQKRLNIWPIERALTTKVRSYVKRKTQAAAIVTTTAEMGAQHVGL